MCTLQISPKIWLIIADKNTFPQYWFFRKMKNEKIILFCQKPGGSDLVAFSELSLGHEHAKRTSGVNLASASVKIRHVFCFTFWSPASLPEIMVELSDIFPLQKPRENIFYVRASQTVFIKYIYIYLLLYIYYIENACRYPIDLYRHLVNELLNSRLVCTIFIMHS